MLRRLYVLNVVFSLVSTAVVWAALPSPGSFLSGAYQTIVTFAEDSALLSPLVTGVISPR